MDLLRRHPVIGGDVFDLQIVATMQATIFGQNLRGESTRNIAVGNLSVALLLFEKAYGRIGDLMPRFIQLCESRLQEDYTPGAA